MSTSITTLDPSPSASHAVPSPALSWAVVLGSSAPGAGCALPGWCHLQLQYRSYWSVTTQGVHPHQSSQSNTCSLTNSLCCALKIAVEYPVPLNTPALCPPSPCLFKVVFLNNNSQQALSASLRHLKDLKYRDFFHSRERPVYSLESSGQTHYSFVILFSC